MKYQPHKASKRRTGAYLSIVLLGSALTMAGAASAKTGPDPKNALRLAESVAGEMMVALANNDVRTDIRALRAIVDKNLVPHIDFRAASGLVLGPHWQAATEAQRVEFINQFRGFLVRFYTEALAGYTRSREIPADLMSFEQDVQSKGNVQAFVTSRVKQPNGSTVPVTYRLLWRDAWQVIDVSVKGISMVKTYRSNFMAKAEQKGLDALIDELRARNLTFASQ